MERRSAASGFDRLIELSNDLCCVLAHDGFFEYVNPAWERVLGWKPQELVGRHAFELIHPDDAARSRELGRDEVTRFENRYQHRDGSWRSLLWSATLSGGRWYAIAKDVSGRYGPTDDARLREDRLYRAIVEQTTQGVWALDGEDQTIFVNRYMAEMLGYHQEEMLGRSYYEFFDSEAADAARAAMDRRRRGVSELRETPLLRKDGSSLFVLIEASPLLDEQGRYTGGVGMVTDISMRKRTEEQLALLAAVVESSSDVVIACSLDGAVQSWNPAAERLFGHSAAEMRGKALSTILPSGEESLLALIDAAARGEFAGPVEIETVAKDGMCIPVDLTAFPVETARGDVGGIAVTMRDVRERHEAERRIRENQRVLGDIEKAGRVGTWEWHIDRGERAWSAEVYRIHGVQPGEFVPTRETLLAAVHSDDRERVRKAVDRAAETFEPPEVR